MSYQTSYMTAHERILNKNNLTKSLSPVKKNPRANDRNGETVAQRSVPAKVRDANTSFEATVQGSTSQCTIFNIVESRMNNNTF